MLEYIKNREVLEIMNERCLELLDEVFSMRKDLFSDDNHSNFANFSWAAISELDRRIGDIQKCLNNVAGYYFGDPTREIPSIMRKTIRVINHIVTNKYVNQKYVSRLIEIRDEIESLFVLVDLYGE